MPNFLRPPRLLFAPLVAIAFLPTGTACGSDGDEEGGERRTAERPATASSASAEAADGRVRLRSIGSFSSPTYVTAPPGDRRRVMIVERRGTVRVLRGGRRLRTPFLDLRRTPAGEVPTDGERGFLSLAFAPDYRSSRRLYVYFTDRQGDITIAELRRSARSADRVDHGTYRVVITQEHRRFSNHNGGQLQFGPGRLLYAAFGDGGGAFDPFKAGQDLSTLLGKMIRIDPRERGARPYSVPASNPFRGREGARPEIWAYGLRNPYRFSFDRRTGGLSIADVGQDQVEEVDFLRRGTGAGANFGWSCFEGTRRISDCDAPGHRRPVLQRRHSSGVCSITGGYVVRDRGLGSLYGRYVYGDFCDSAIRSARLRTTGAAGDRSTGLRVEATSSFGEDACGRVYVASLSGRVSRFTGSRRSSCTRSIFER